MGRWPYRQIGSGSPRNFRLFQNANLNDISADMQEVIQKQNEMDAATQQRDNNLQTQLDNVVAEGDSSPQASQAQVGADGTNFPSLKTRLDTEYNKTMQRLDKNDQGLQQTRGMRDTFFRGIAIRGWSTGWFDSTTARDDFLALVDNIHATDVEMVVNFYQNGLNDSGPFTYPINDTEIENYLKYLKDNGKRVFFKPHLEPGGTLWRASIQPTDIDTWFNNYQSRIVTWAALCEQYGVEVFSVGSEYYWLTDNYPDRWRTLIASVRSVFSGYVTYGAGFNNAKGDEAQRLQFWDALDFIALNFYIRGDFTPGTSYSDDYIRSFMNFDSQNSNPLDELNALVLREGKRIIFSEFGVPFTATGDHVQGLSDDFMAQYYRIMLNEVIRYDWLIGTYQWGYDYVEMDLSSSAPVKLSVGDFYNQKHLTARSKAVNTKGLTYSASGSYQRIAEIKLPNRNNIFAAMRINIDAEKATSNRSFYGSLYMKLSVGSDGYVRPSVFIEKGNIGGNFFYTLSGTDLILWALTDGSPFRAIAIENNYPIFCKIFDLNTQSSTSLPSGAIAVLSASQFKSVDTSLHSGSQNLQIDYKDIFSRYTLNGNYILSLQPSISGLATHYIIEFIQDATGYRTLALNGINQPMGTVMVDPTPGASSYVCFLWNGSSWTAFNIGGPLAKTVSRTTTPSIGYGDNSNITCRRAGNVITYKWAINVTGTLGSGAEIDIFHAEYWPTNETYYGTAFADALGSLPAGSVRWQGTTMYFTPSQTLQNTWLRGTLSFVVDN